jgi:hypothetical protein
VDLARLQGVWQVIPDEAVEAAAVGISSALFRNKEWARLDEEARQQFRRDARAALESAAPHLLAQGWDEAVTTLYMGNAINQDHMKTMWTQNPYRKPTDAN